MDDPGGLTHDEPIGRFEHLVKAWAERDPFDGWVREVSAAYFVSRLRLEGAAKLLATTPVELQAVLNLATLEDEELSQLAKAPPPKTTWLTFALATTDGIQAGLKALSGMTPGTSPFHAVHDAIHEIEGPSILEKVSALPGPTITHMGSKAKQYNLLAPKQRKALVDMGIWKRTGKSLTPRQTAYLYGLLQELVDGGAIKRESPDGDQEQCDSVLDALGA